MSEMPNLPPGYRWVTESEMAEMADTEHAARAVANHETMEWLNGLDTKDILRILSLLKMCQGETAVNFCGIFSGLLIARGYCRVCGSNHDPEELLTSLPPEPSVGDISTPVGDEMEARVRAEAMEEYNLEDVTNPVGVICRGCGLRYVSLEDRMLRAPGIDGCHGCQHKSAHG